jgi:hypothetical protein
MNVRPGGSSSSRTPARACPLFDLSNFIKWLMVLALYEAYNILGSKEGREALFAQKVVCNKIISIHAQV